MVKGFRYIPSEKALEEVLKYIQSINEIEEIPIINSVGRILAEDIIVKEDIPPRDTSHFDGYAANYEDTLNASYENPVRLKIKGVIAPNEIHNYEISKGEVYRISTGGYLPKGANTIIPIESVRVLDRETIQITRKSKLMEHVIKCGEDYKSGEIALKKCRIIKPVDVDLMAYMKIKRVKVYRKPVIAILAVGDELIIEEISPHTYMIMKLIEEFGATPIDMGIAKDDSMDIMDKIGKSLKICDLLITIGGCSVGEMDLVPDAVMSMPKSKIVVRGIMRVPGRQTSFAIVNGKPILMLPGLIQSTIIGFYTLGLPLILKLSNNNAKTMKMKVKSFREIIIENMLPFERAVFGRIIELKEIPIVEILTGKSLLRRMIVDSHGFIVIPPFKNVINKGEDLELNLFKPNLYDNYGD